MVSGKSLQNSLRNLRQCSVVDQIQLCRDLDNTELANEVYDADKDVFLKNFRQFWIWDMLVVVPLDYCETLYTRVLPLFDVIPQGQYAC
jgi:hypothetical protein